MMTANFMMFVDDVELEVEGFHVSKSSGEDEISQRGSVCGLRESQDLDMLIACWL